MTIELKEWAIPIRFEGVDLSPISIVIDHLGMYGNLPGISEEASLWLWQFTICRGRQRTDSAETIEKIVTEILTLVKHNRKHVLDSVPKHFDGSFTEEHLNFWIADLEMMLSLCKGKSKCAWGSD